MDRPQKPEDFMKIFEKKSKEIIGLMSDKKSIDFISKCNQEYMHWDQLRYRKTPDEISHDVLWALMKLSRRNTYRHLKFGDEAFTYSITDDSFRKLHILDKESAGNIETGQDTIGAENRDKYIISSLMEEAIASSQLEGAATTRKVAKDILRLNKKPTNYSECMIVNGYQTMQRVVRMKETALTPEIILDLHKEITKGTLKNKEYEGRFREDNEVYIGDELVPEKIYYVPPDYKKIPALMEEFCKFANNDDEEFIHPIIKGVILHFLIGYIHPFNDGNGRTARTIFYWYVLRKGYWLFEFMAISRILLRSKTRYGLSYLYTETDGNDLTYFINYNLSAIEEALKEMERYILKKQKEQAESMRLIRGLKNINLRQAEILKDFIRHPEKEFVISEIVNTYGVVYETAKNDLYSLSDLGYLEKTKIKNKFVFMLAKRPILEK